MELNFNNKTVIVLAPHPDDGEFGCGATIVKWISKGANVWYVAFSPCIKSVPEGFDKGVLYCELYAATAVLGIPRNQVVKLGYEVREFERDRQQILEKLVELKKEIQPDVVLLPNSRDIHQDHGVIHREGVRAFKNSTILGYDLPWNYTELNTNFFVGLEEKHISKKVKAIAAYKSQGFRPYADLEFFKGLARLKGIQSGKRLAEGFEVFKVVTD